MKNMMIVLTDWQSDLENKCHNWSYQVSLLNDQLDKIHILFLDQSLRLYLDRMMYMMKALLVYRYVQVGTICKHFQPPNLEIRAHCMDCMMIDQ